ncbi:hypothetical protein D3C86_1015990 [compost metagenome]
MLILSRREHTDRDARNVLLLELSTGAVDSIHKLLATCHHPASAISIPQGDVVGEGLIGQHIAYAEVGLSFSEVRDEGSLGDDAEDVLIDHRSQLIGQLAGIVRAGVIVV